MTSGVFTYMCVSARFRMRVIWYILFILQEFNLSFLNLPRPTVVHLSLQCPRSGQEWAATGSVIRKPCDSNDWWSGTKLHTLIPVYTKRSNQGTFLEEHINAWLCRLEVIGNWRQVGRPPGFSCGGWCKIRVKGVKYRLGQEYQLCLKLSYFLLCL